MSNYYERQTFYGQRPGFDVMGTVRAEREQMHKLGNIDQGAHRRAENTVDYDRVKLASVVVQVAAMPEAERAAFVAFCRRLVGECGNPEAT